MPLSKQAKESVIKTLSELRATAFAVKILDVKNDQVRLRLDLIDQSGNPISHLNEIWLGNGDSVNVIRLDQALNVTFKD